MEERDSNPRAVQRQQSSCVSAAMNGLTADGMEYAPTDALSAAPAVIGRHDVSRPARNDSYYFGRSAGLEHLDCEGPCYRRRAIRAHGRHLRYAEGARGVAGPSHSRQSDLLISRARKSRSRP
jgi:hypothetical protein